MSTSASAPNAAAAGLFVLQDPAWRAKLARMGWWLLLCPPVGWPAVLGVRKALARGLFESDGELLPPLAGRVGLRFLDGLGGIGVQLGYFAPLYAALAALLHARGYEPGPRAGLALLVVVLVPYLSPLAFPGALALLWLDGGGWVTAGETLVLGTLFVAIVFVLPAGYLEVTRTGRYRDAFALHRSLPFVARNLAAYGRAWLVGGAQAALSACVPPLAPWGIAWHYSASVFAFNELLYRAHGAPPGAWIERTLAGPLAAPRPHLGLGRATDAAGEPVAVLDLGLVSAPLPRVRRGRSAGC